MHWNSLVTDKYNIVAIRTILENEAFTTTIQQKKPQRKESNRRKTKSFNCTTNHTALLSFT